MLHVLRPATTRALVALSLAGSLTLAPIAPNAANAHPVVAASTAADAVDAALEQVGTAYRWGGSSPSGFDCSGLTSWAYAQAGVDIPRTSSAQYGQLPRIAREDLRRGDLVFHNSPVSHVAMYIGDGQIIESPNSGSSVRVRDLADRAPTGFARPQL